MRAEDERFSRVEQIGFGNAHQEDRDRNPDLLLFPFARIAYS